MTDRGIQPKKRLLVPLLCAVLLLGAFSWFLLSPSPGYAGYLRRAKPELVLGQDRISKRSAAFIREGLLKVSHDFWSPEMLAADGEAALTLYGQPCPAPAADRFQKHIPPSTALLPPLDTALRQDLVEISLVCHADHLFDPEQGIVTNPLERGQPSERPAWFTARQGGKVLAESPLGLRIHGGHSREQSFKSFSLVFREAYGGREVSPPGLFFGKDTPGVHHLVLMNAWHPSRFNAAMATEIAAALGCKVSRCVPAVVYLNGTMIRAPFFIYEHQSPAFIKDHFGYEKVDWVRLKAAEKQENTEYVKWRRHIRRVHLPCTMEQEAKLFDLEDLSAWALAMSFTATTDTNQGGYFKAREVPGAVWRSLVWDMDCAFNDDLVQKNGQPFVYADNSFHVLIGDRARLFFRLFEQSRDYRRYFEKYATAHLEGSMSPDKLIALADHYLELARTHPATNDTIIRVMEDSRIFLSDRHEKYLRYLKKQLHHAEQDALVQRVSDPGAAATP